MKLMKTDGPRGPASARNWIEHVRSRVDFKQVDAEARKGIQLIVTGSRRNDFIAALKAAGEPREDAIVALEHLSDVLTRDLASTRAAVYCPDADASNGALADTASLPFAVFVVRTGEGQGVDEARLATVAPSARPSRGSASVYYLSAMSLEEYRKFLLPDIAQVYRGNEIALAAAIPAFRAIVAAKLTMDCAMNCLKIAAASAVADHIPVLGLITGGIASAGDTIAITVLQMRMLLRIAAAYGKQPDFTRIVELMPVVGGGYGWRALARELSGFIPIAGIPIKAAIAYAGTLVVGQAASYYYETGVPMSRSAVAAMYREASDRAKEFVRHFITRPKRHTRTDA
jgi:uncharacterized protein (DUF697 family)